ncbi:MAG: hypothetical protein IJD07_02940 [Clostridia bacterium]|nr:hypothetical protein [Clostridia bacterium]
METREQYEVFEIIDDFRRRAAKRASLDAGWNLNYEFVKGKQFSRINPDLSLSESERDFYWQQRTVYNHIAPIVEARLSRLARINPVMSVRPISDDADDISAAKLSSKILSSLRHKLQFDEKINEGTMWAEIVGSIFYKVVWDTEAGDVLALDGESAYRAGEVRIEVCPPFEIYPASLEQSTIEEQSSIMHAKSVPLAEIFDRWGVLVEGKDGYALVIEKYERPSATNPNGRLCIVAGDKMVYKGELPYVIGEDGERALPFVKQDCLKSAGSFFGVSVVDRLIPLQKAYNSVKNRKHEFLNRLAMGVLAVEDGSVDIENLEEEGLSPGKILVYRMGSTPPKFLDGGNVPEEFNDEEEKLLNEFVTVSGVSEILSASGISSRITSATALQLLIEQEEERINLTAVNQNNALIKISKFALRLYKQFGKSMRLTKLVGKTNAAEIVKWKNSDIGSDDIVFEASSSSSHTARRELLFETVNAGLFDGESKIPASTKSKLLEILGFGSWEFADGSEDSQAKQKDEMPQDATQTMATKADGENSSVS